MRLPRTVSVVVALVLLTACSSATNGAGVLPSATRPAPTTSTLTNPPPANSTPPTPPATSTAPSTAPPPATPLRTVTVTGTDGSTGAVVSIWAERTDMTCPDHAYGTVINYLSAHLCTGLHRMLATTTLGDRAVGLAVSDLGFKGDAPAVYQTAGNFEELVKKDGTGNIKDLMREGYRLPAGPTSVPSPDAFAALGQDAGVEILDAWYLTGSTPDNDPKLVALEQSLFLQLG